MILTLERASCSAREPQRHILLGVRRDWSPEGLAIPKSRAIWTTEDRGTHSTLETAEFGDQLPNPNIAKAVASYAGSMNIREYLCVVRPTLVAGSASQTHEIQRQKIYERFGSATRLKAGSHPIGGNESVVTTGGGTVGIFFGASGNRSPLWV
jgi:hypothetical protein